MFFIKSAIALAFKFPFLEISNDNKSTTINGLEPWTTSKVDVFMVLLREELEANSDSEKVGRMEG